MRKSMILWPILALFALVSSQALAQGKTDAQFVEKAAQGGMFEVQAGQVAILKASNPDVKAFGQQMVMDHGKANDQLETVAQAQGFEMPVELGEKYQEKIQKLNDASQDDFDREYMNMMVEDHQEDVKKFKEMEEKVENPELKSWVSQTLPVLQSHLERAEALEKGL